MSSVHDPFNIRADASLPFAAAALDPAMAQCVLAQALDHPAALRLDAIRVLRHKAGRRCLIAYDAALNGEPVTVLGKIRAKGLDAHTYKLHQALWQANFDAHSADNISVPQALGLVPQWNMWLQRSVLGVPVTSLLAQHGGVALATRMADVAHKLHRANVPPRRTHNMVDELRILHERLDIVRQQYPAWSKRLDRLLAACAHLGASITPQQCGIHRDFYADQVLVDGERLWLVDLDLYCAGDAGLDIGNFAAHIAEWSLRTLGSLDALFDHEHALIERYVALAGAAVRPAIYAYATLTLARHIWISTLFTARQPFTAPLLELCEARLLRWLA